MLTFLFLPLLLVFFPSADILVHVMKSLLGSLVRHNQVQLFFVNTFFLFFVVFLLLNLNHDSCHICFELHNTTKYNIRLKVLPNIYNSLVTIYLKYGCFVLTALFNCSQTKFVAVILVLWSFFV